MSDPRAFTSFAKEVGFRGNAVARGENSANIGPNIGDEGSTHWDVTLKSPTGDEIEIPFTIGSGWGDRKPSLSAVMMAVLAELEDARECGSYEHWRERHGIGDSDEARKVWEAFGARERFLADGFGPEVLGVLTGGALGEVPEDVLDSAVGPSA